MQSVWFVWKTIWATSRFGQTLQIGHYQKEWGTGPEKAPRRLLGSLEGQAKQKDEQKWRITAAAAVCAARFTAIVAMPHFCKSFIPA